MGKAKPQPRRSLADKLDHLFETVHPAKGQYTHEQVAAALRQAGGPTISATYVWQLRKGIRDNPTKHHLEALAGFFGVPPSYFFDEDAAAQVDAELELLVAMRDANVRSVALRSAGLSPATLASIRGIIEAARQIEGLAPIDGDPKSR